MYREGLVLRSIKSERWIPFQFLALKRSLYGDELPTRVQKHPGIVIYYLVCLSIANIVEMSIRTHRKANAEVINEATAKCYYLHLTPFWSHCLSPLEFSASPVFVETLRFRVPDDNQKQSKARKECPKNVWQEKWVPEEDGRGW